MGQKSEPQVQLLTDYTLLLFKYLHAKVDHNTLYVRSSYLPTALAGKEGQSIASTCPFVSTLSFEPTDF